MYRVGESQTHQYYEFYDLKVKRDLWLYFLFFQVWSSWANLGRCHLQRLFSLEFGLFLDSNLVSRIMKDLELNLAPKQRIREFRLVHKSKFEGKNLTEILLKPEAEANLPEFRQMDEQSKSALLHTIKEVCSGNTLSEVQDKDWTMKPFEKLKDLGSKMKSWTIHKTMDSDAAAIAIDEKMVEKSFDLEKNPNLGHGYVSRRKTYLPCLLVEVAGLIRPGRMAEVVGHYFPYPQRDEDENGKRKPMRKHEYLLGFLEALHESFGHLIMLADANYTSRKLISWFQSKNWPFIMRISPTQKYLLKPLQEKFDADSNVIACHKILENDEFGGWVKILAFRRWWTDAKGVSKEKRYFLITNLLDEPPRDLWRFYRMRWTLENTFKCLPVLDKTPGTDENLLRGYFALVFHAVAPICYQSRSTTRTLAKLLELPVEIKKKEIVWKNLSTRFTRRLLLIAYRRSTELSQVLIKV